MEDDQKQLPALIDNAVSIPQQGTKITLCPTNLDLSTRHGKAMLLKMAGPSDLSLRDKPEIKMCAVYWAMLPDTQTDPETGEVSEFVRTVLMDEQGRTFRTTSAHGPMRLMAMLQLFSPSEWAEGINVIITERKSRRGTTYHDVQVEI